MKLRLLNMSIDLIFIAISSKFLMNIFWVTRLFFKQLKSVYLVRIFHMFLVFHTNYLS